MWKNSPGTPGLNERWLTVALLMFLCLLYIPFAGNYGLWDPWETHYGEVARQMVERNDWISLWWPGSPQDAATFWSKPVLTFWLMALSMKIFGLGHPGVAHAAEMTVGWTAEWALRLPFVLLGLAGVWAVWHLCRRIAGRGVAFWSSAVLCTSTQWSMISRQAMTDMAFVTPMTVGLVFAGLALLLPKEEVRRALPRKEAQVLGLRISWPHDPAFYWVVGLYVLCTVPQLLVNCIQLQSWTFVIGRHSYRTLGLVPMLPFVALFLLSLPFMAAARDRRSIYLWVTYITGGVATLAKGPAGIALPVLIVFFFLLCTGRFAEFLGEKREQPPGWGSLQPEPLRFLADHDGLQVVLGILLFIVVGAPWYMAMLVRHGIPFWMEMIGDNYVHRVQGRHGDRGSYEYYLRQLGLGLFPWSGVVAASVLVAGRWLRQWIGTPRRGLVVFCLVWFVIDFMIVALVNTKFHHYILPALPALAILAGLFLDELCKSRAGRLPLDGVGALLLVGLPITWLSGRDMANFPARIGWLFNYDYVNAPGGGRPWPLVSLYGERYEYGPQIFTLVAIAMAALGLLGFLLGRYLPPRRALPGELAGTIAGPAEQEAQRGLGADGAAFLGLFFVGLLVAGLVIAPRADAVTYWSSSKLPTSTMLPGWMRLGYLVPAGAATLFLLLSLWLAARRGLLAIGVLRGPVTFAAGLVFVAGMVWNCWVLDRFMVDISPHWSQKGVFATYYRLRKGPEEPVLAWQMYWRGENFYTRNDIYDHKLDAAEKTVFLGDHRTDKVQAYFKAHRGRRVFVLLERNQLETVRGLLPTECRPSLQVVDESNNKVYLAVAQL